MSDSSTREDRIAAGCLQVVGFLIVGVAILLLIWPGGDNEGDSADSDIAWETYDVTIDIRDDGSIHVTEYQEVAFDGRFTVGFAEIPMERIESIDNVRVTLEEGVVPDDDDKPWLATTDDEPQGAMVDAEEVSWSGWDERTNTFRARQDGGMYVIDYAFDPTPRYSGYPGLDDSGNGTRTIILEYDAYGVIRDYPEAEEPWQQIHWLAIADEVTAIAPIESASVTVNLPQEVSTEDLVVAPEPDSQTGATMVWTQSNMDEGDSFDVQAAFPTITDATSPVWQEAADARDASLEERDVRRNAGQLMLILAGIAVVVLGALTLLYTWYRSIREPQVGLVHQQLTEPPGDLSAILIGSLMDEEVHPQDIAAGVLDLDRQGLITIRHGEDAEPERYYLTLNTRTAQGPAWTREMLRTIFGQNAEEGTTRGFSALRALFNDQRESLQAAIDRTLVDDGYYEELPETSRRHWTWVTYGFAVAGVVAALAILIWAWSWTWLAIVPIVPGIAMWWFGKKLTPHVAMKTHKGAEAAASWGAFQRYLDSSRYQLSTHTWSDYQVRYAPWLLAFGIERGWLTEMNRPLWESPHRANRSHAPRAEGGSGAWSWGESNRPGTRIPSGVETAESARRLPGPPAWRPTTASWDPGRWGDMQSASNSVSQTLSSMSDGAFSMIGDMLESIGSSSGGGGGSSRSGSSFRGSSSRSGGGRSRSSSGGGRRGFR